MRLTPRPLFVAFALFAVALAGLPPRPADAKVFSPTVYTLDNGLEVVVVTNRRAPVVTQMVWYKVGSADEPRGKSGIAHFLEHLMFKGTKEHGPGQFSAIVARNGGSENAFTTYDYTAFFQTVAKDRLPLVMELEADRMANLQLTDKVVLPERDVILEERRMRIDNDPGSQLAEAARADLWVHHPYGRPIIGWENEMATLTTRDALDFYGRWYAPNNAVLVVSGDVDPAEVRKLAEKYYGPLPRKDVPPRDRVQEPRHWAGSRVELTSAEAGRPSISVTYRAPSYHTAEPRERAYALEVLSEILDGSVGRLYRALVVEQPLAAGAGAGYDPDGLDGSSFAFWATPRPTVAVDKVEAALRAQIATLLDKGVSEDEVAKAKQRLIDQTVYANDSAGSAAHIIGKALTTGSSVADVEAWPDRIQAVTKAEVEAAARAVLDPVNSVTSVLRTKPTS
ncbi:zinc protease [Tistlia consotensis]|uniref:Zinc protease n=1 Tax=Tistlia consotensis USBA 355 TaxID=560819 RepID=A0A1Y6CKL8_9PROT|nr:pitrilysin family protein [Tistlia consotensis]SMF71912.1 zinc protease [Tistlia consotensis USBA 355]SNS05941.1 zinc protease [Tistlia consotensis]